MGENQESLKTIGFTVNELCTLRSQIDFSDRSYIDGERWDNERRAEYVLKLLLGKLTEEKKITLYVKNIQSIAEFNVKDHISVFVSHHYTPAEPGYEELEALYRYLGYYNHPEDEYGLDNAIRRPGCVELLLEQQESILRHRKKAPPGPSDYLLSTMYSFLPQSYAKEILNIKTTVVFRVLPSTPKNDDRVHIESLHL